MRICFTGHRRIDESLVEHSIRQYLSGLAHDTEVIVGGAIGVDTVAGEVALDLGLELWVCLPFHPRIMCKFWSEEQKPRLKHILKHARRTTIVNQSYSVAGYQLRNQRMVDNSHQVIAWFDGSRGGTFNCVQYAQQVGKSVVNLYSA